MPTRDNYSDWKLWQGWVLEDGDTDDQTYRWVGWARSEADAKRLAIYECCYDRGTPLNMSQPTFDDATRFCTVELAELNQSRVDSCPRCEGYASEVGLGWHSCVTCGCRYVAHGDPDDELKAILRDKATFEGIDARFAEMKAADEECI